MGPQFRQLTLANQDGQTGTFTYGLSQAHGWDVRAELDGRIVVRHCSSWRGVERLYEWLRTAPRDASPRSNV